jgi:hypothetical protein
MPSGYTAELYEGKDVSLPEFVLKCARAFGALIEMRDESMDAPIPDKFEISPYYPMNLFEAGARLSRIQQWTDQEADDKARESWEENVQAVRESNARAAATGLRYIIMIGRVKQWQPPTADHEELKNFMLSQLRESYKFDVHMLAYPVRLSGAEYREQEIARAKRDIGYYTEQMFAEVNRVQGRTQWVKDLRASLKGVT